MADETTKVTVRMSSALHKRLKIAAVMGDTSVQDLVVESIEKHLATLDA